MFYTFIVTFACTIATNLQKHSIHIGYFWLKFTYLTEIYISDWNLHICLKFTNILDNSFLHEYILVAYRHVDQISID